MENLSILELYQIKKRLLKEGIDSNLLEDVLNAIKVIENKIYEDDFSSGMASGIPGENLSMNWASGGGSGGSGDISVPYNPSGNNRMVQKLEMGKNHGPRTGKKTREKKVDVKALRAALRNRKDFKSSGVKKVMNFNNFVKDDISVIKKESIWNNDIPDQLMIDWIEEYKYNNSSMELSSSFKHIGYNNSIDVDEMRNEFIEKFSDEFSDISYSEMIDIFNSCL